MTVENEHIFHWGNSKFETHLWEQTVYKKVQNWNIYNRITHAGDEGQGKLCTHPGRTVLTFLNQDPFVFSL